MHTDSPMNHLATVESWFHHRCPPADELLLRRGRGQQSAAQIAGAAGDRLAAGWCTGPPIGRA